MVRNYKKQQPGKRTYQRYTPDDLTKAVTEVKRGKISLRKASQLFNIPIGTLSNKCRLHPKHSEKVGRPCVFTPEEEQAFCDHLITVSNWGFPFDSFDLRLLVKRYLDLKGITVTRFKNNTPSYDWACLFLKRHPELSQRNCQNIKSSRAKISKESTVKYFDNLQKSLTDENGEYLPAHMIFNHDETNLTDDPGIKKCLFKRGIKYMLQDMRGNTNTDAPQRKKKRLNVEAGKSFTSNEPSTGSDDEPQHQQHDSNYESEHYSSEEGEELMQGQDDVPLYPTMNDIREGSFLLVKLEGQKKTKYYVGKVISIEPDDELPFEVKFLRHSSKISGKFIWPTVDDISGVTIEEVIKVLKYPEENRRGLFFRVQEFKNELKYLE